MPPSCLLGGRKETTMKGKRSVCSRKNPCPINSGITMLWTALEGYEYCIGELMVFCIVFTPVGQMFLCWKMASSQRALKHNFNDSLDCFFFFFFTDVQCKDFMNLFVKWNVVIELKREGFGFWQGVNALDKTMIFCFHSSFGSDGSSLRRVHDFCFLCTRVLQY